MYCAKTFQPTLPAALPANACFAIVAPAGAARLDAHKVSQWFVDRGYRCRIYPGALQAQGYLAGPDQQRLQDLHAAFADPAMDAILCMRGGYGSMRLLDQLDFELIRRNPKPLIGYSDITALLEDTFAPLGVPVLAGWRSGHCDPNVCLPLGARVRLDSVQQTLVLEQDLFRA